MIDQSELGVRRKGSGERSVEGGAVSQCARAGPCQAERNGRSVPACVIFVKRECSTVEALARTVGDVQFVLRGALVDRDLELAAEEVVQDAGAVLDGFGDEDGVVFLQDVIVFDCNKFRFVR